MGVTEACPENGYAVQTVNYGLHCYVLRLDGLKALC